MKKNRRVHAIILTSIVLMSTATALAVDTSQLTQGFEGIGTIVNSFTTNIVKAVTTLFATLAMAAFFYGIVQYIWGVRDGESKKIENGNKFMIWGLVGLFIMFSVWGIIIFFQRIFFQGIDTNRIVIPQVQIDGSSTNNDGGAGGLPTSPTATVDCRTAADGTSCPLGGGRSGQCGTSDGGTRGCYAVPCGPNEIRDAAGNCYNPDLGGN